MVSTATVVAETRRLVPAAVVHVRHAASGVVYEGLRSSLSADQELSGRGERQNADGAVRLIVSELRPPLPKPGDLLELTERSGEDPKKRVVSAMDYDSLRETVRVSYGEQYG